MAERSYRWLFWFLAVGGAVLDQVGKYGVFRWLYSGSPHVEWPRGHGVFWLEANYSVGQLDMGGWLAPLRTWGSGDPPFINHGALFGQQPTQWLDWLLGSHLSETYSWADNAVFSGISVLAAVAIVWWATRRSTVRDWCLSAALGLILAGTAGNLYDRVVFFGVRDFLHFQIENVINWPIFNLADACLCCGAGLLLLHAFWGRPQTQPSDTAPAKELAEAK